MADVRVTVTINLGEWARMMSSEGIVGRAVRNAADTTVRRARSNILRSGRVRTGRMLRGIGLGRFSTRTTEVTQQITAEAPYTKFQNSGTRYITGARFLDRAVDDLSAGDFRA